MNKLWVRIALSYVLVFFLAVSIPTALFTILDKLNIILIEDLPFGRIQELFTLREQRGATGNLPGGLIDFLIMSSIIGITAGALVSRQVAKPISKMADAARRIGEKDFETRLEVRGTEEINLKAFHKGRDQ